MRSLVLDGVTGSGKTRILWELRRLMASELSFDSQIWLSELLSDRLLEDERADGTICGDAIQQHMAAILESCQTLMGLVQNSKFGEDYAPSGLSVILERGILSHLSHPQQPRCSHKYTNERIEAQLTQMKNLGFTQVVLELPEERIEEAVLSTLLYRGECWSEFIFTLGKDSYEIVAYFKAWQDRLIHRSSAYSHLIPTVRLVVKNSNFLAYGEQIRDLLHA